MSANIWPETTPVDITSPPFIEVAGIHNFRDIGGYPITASKSVKTGVLYRCAEPTLVTEDGISTIRNLGITHFYDLRSSNEIQKNIDAGRGWGKGVGRL